MSASNEPETLMESREAAARALQIAQQSAMDEFWQVLKKVIPLCLIRRLLDGTRPGWESDLRMSRERSHTHEGASRPLAQPRGAANPAGTRPSPASRR